MIPWVQVAVVQAPGGGELRLMRRGAEFSITIGGEELMNSRRGGSETALGLAACERLDAPSPRLLIGGLGMGFTLRAVLSSLSAEARITVAELVPDVIAWAHGPLAEVFEGSLDDPRVTLVVGDVGALIEAGRATYDAILLDVDNGPEGVVRSANDGLYGGRGLQAARRALKPGGVLAVWSASRNPAFVRRLARAGFGVQEVAARSGGRGGARHVVWIATAPLDPR